MPRQARLLQPGIAPPFKDASRADASSAGGTDGGGTIRQTFPVSSKKQGWHGAGRRARVPPIDAMSGSRFDLRRRLVLVSCCVLSLSPGALAVRAESPAASFGFTGPEIFPVDRRISHLNHGDFNGDGLEDLIVVNNARSKLNLLINRTGQTNRAASPTVGPHDINKLPPDARFRIESIASEKRISALVVADLNGDDRPDLAYYGEPKELVVQYREGTNSWSTPRRFAINDGRLDVNALASGDLDGDGRQDLALLGESVLHLFLQRADGTLAEPRQIPYSGTVRAAQILDLNGDGRQDLLLVNWDLANPFRFRLQGAHGRLGPEIHFTLPAVRSYWPADLNGDGKAELVTVAQKSGRAQLLSFERQPGESLDAHLTAGQFQVLPLTRTSKGRRGVAWADVTGDGLPDLLVAEPDSGRLTLYVQEADGGLGRARHFPTFTGVTGVAAGDWNEDGTAEIFLLSADERQLGVTRREAGGRIGFPETLALGGRPLAMTVGALKPGETPVLAAIIERDHRRELVLRSARGAPVRQQLNEKFKGKAAALRLHDLDQDGLMDFIVLVPYEKLKLLRQRKEGTFEEIDLAAPGGGSELPALSAGDVDGDGKPELLLAQKNFVRAVVLRRNGGDTSGGKKENTAAWSWRVKEQINGASSRSRITAAAMIQPGDAPATLLLLDAERKALSVCQRDDADVWQIVRNLTLPENAFTRLQPLILGKQQRPSVAFVGLNTVAWLPFGGQVWKLVEWDDYETPIENGYLRDVVSGDLNHDGRPDLVFLETNRHYLDLVVFEPPRQLVPATRWQVFEERTFRSRRGDAPEPREALIVDVTGDGRKDLVILVHDRILLYPQE